MQTANERPARGQDGNHRNPTEPAAMEANVAWLSCRQRPLFLQVPVLHDWLCTLSKISLAFFSQNTGWAKKTRTVFDSL